MPQFYCIHCGQRIEADNAVAGSAVSCPSCGGEISVPVLKSQAGEAAITPEVSRDADSATPPEQGTRIGSILCSGWGIFLVIIGIVSVTIDLASPTITTSTGESIAVFRGGGFTLGWIFIVLMVAPLALLCSGWGIIPIIAGIVFVIIDLASPTITTSTGESIAVFRGGSFTLGWIFIVVLMVAPAALARAIGLAPLNRPLAICWCLLIFFGWILVHAGAAPHQQPKPNLALIGGMVLCWRLLTRKGDVSLESPVKDRVKKPDLHCAAHVPAADAFLECPVKNRVKKPGVFWAALVSATALTLILLHQPYSYNLDDGVTILLRFISCISSAAIVVWARENKIMWLAWSHGAVVVLFNPLFRVDLDGDSWQLLDFLTGAFMLVTAVIIGRTSTSLPSTVN